MSRTQLKSQSNKKAWIWGIIFGLYIISPLDIIPDVIPVFGWMDDLLVGLGGSIRVILYVKAAKTAIKILYSKVKELITFRFLLERTKIEVPDAVRMGILKVKKNAVKVGIFGDTNNQIAEINYESSVGVDPNLHSSSRKYEILT